MSFAARKRLDREPEAEAPEAAAGEFESFVAEVAGEMEAFAARMDASIAPPAALDATTDALDPWFLDRERFEWEWVSFDERVIEEPR
jgi:hypothetical protein